MADQSDIEIELVTIVSAALYPNGMEMPSAPGPLCRIFRGWPNSAALDADLKAGRINVSIFPGEASPRLAPAYPDEWQTVAKPPTLTATVNGLTVTFAGSAAEGQVAGILLNAKPYVYRIVASDTAAHVAANLAETIRADYIVNNSAATVTIPSARDLLARVVCDQPASRELRRQTQNFRITCWCPTPSSRDTAAAMIDAVLAAMNFLTLANNSKARLLFNGGTVADQSQQAGLFRRDLFYSVEYATTVSTMQPTMLFGVLTANARTITA